jgi:hypothetical protein
MQALTDPKEKQKSTKTQKKGRSEDIRGEDECA